MYTNKSIRLHSKCLNILDMLQTIGNRIEENKRSLKLYDENKMDHWLYFIRTRISYVQRLETDEAIQLRLASYYLRTFNKLHDNVIKESNKFINKI